MASTALTPKQIYCICFILVFEVIILPISCCIIYTYFKYRFSQLIYQRHYSLILISQIMFLFMLCIERPFKLMLVCELIPMSDAAYFTSTALWSTGMWTVFFMVCLRIWIVSFAVRLARSMEKAKWKNIINACETSWIFEHLQTWGNLRYCSIRVCAIGSVTNAIYISLVVCRRQKVLMDGVVDIDDYFMIAVMLVFITGMMVVRCRTPTFNDTLGIKPEITFYIWAPVSYMAWFFLIRLTGLMAVSPFVKIADHTLLAIVMALYIFVPSYITLRSLSRFIGTTRERLTLTLNTNSSPLTADGSATASSSNRKRKRNHAIMATTVSSQTQLFHELLENYEAFEIFVVHVQKEFSIENIVAYVEFHQLAHYVLPSTPSDVRQKFRERHNIALPYIIPISSILCNTHFSFKMKVSLLHHKYVKRYAILELNLPSALRLQWFDFANSHLQLDIKESNKIRTATGVAQLWRPPSIFQASVETIAEEDEEHEHEHEQKMHVDDAGYEMDEYLSQSMTQITLSTAALSISKPTNVQLYKANDNLSQGHKTLTRIATKLTHKTKSDSLNSNFDEENIFLNAPTLKEEFAIKVLDLIENVMDECYQLMRDAFSRFDEEDILRIRKMKMRRQ